MKIVDVRCRLTSFEAGDYFRKAKLKNKSAPTSEAFRVGTVEAYFGDLDRAGVTTGVSVSGNNPGGSIGKWTLPDRTTPNDLLADVQSKNWGRFLGVAGVDASGTFHDPMEELARCRALGLRAAFIEPGRVPGWDLDDHRLYPIYEFCQEAGMTLIPQTSGLLGGRNIDYAHPRHIDQLAEDFPVLRIVAGHGCYPYVREMIIVAQRRENVWVSPDMYIFDIGTEDWVKAVNENVRGDFAEKFLFGSAYPSKALEPFVKSFDELPWRDEVRQLILYRNALRAFDLEGDPTFRRIYELD